MILNARERIVHQRSLLMSRSRTLMMGSSVYRIPLLSTYSYTTVGNVVPSSTYTTVVGNRRSSLSRRRMIPFCISAGVLSPYYRCSISSFSTVSRLTTVKDIFRGHVPIDSRIELVGWIRSVRAQKHTTFIEFNDGSIVTNIQIIASSKKKEHDNTEKGKIAETAALPLTTGSSIRVQGTLVKSPKTGQPVEIIASTVMVVGTADPFLYPLQKKEHTKEYLRDIVHLRARTPLISSMLRIRSSLFYAIQLYFKSSHFIHINTPILTSNDCEGAGELFQVNTPIHRSSSNNNNSTKAASAEPASSSGFFNKNVYLTVSGQLHLEAFACALEKVYTFGPTFRAENSNTPRHLAEFWMVEPEIAPGTMVDAMNLAEQCVEFVTGYILKDVPEDLAYFNKYVDSSVLSRLERLSAGKFARITYTEAIEQLSAIKQKEWKYPLQWSNGLAYEHERYLAEEIVKGPVFVTHYPSLIKPFYARPTPNESATTMDRSTVEAFDFLVPGVGELIGGSAREERYEPLQKRMQELGLLSKDPDNNAIRTTVPAVADPNTTTLDWYLDLRKYGTVHHAGWGLGFERLVLLATGLDNIRDTIPIPRTPGSCRM